MCRSVPKFVTSAFNSKLKYEKLAAILRALQNTQSLVISGRCCLLPMRTEGIDNVKIALAELSKAWNTDEGKRQT